MDILIVGCGDTGRRLAELHRNAGDGVTVTSRSTERCALLAEDGFTSRQLDLDNVNADQPIAAEVVYLLAPPGGSGGHDPRTHNLLQWLDTGTLPRRFVYISTTGVYGDCQGDWVTENRPRNPHSQRASRRAAAEQQLEIWAQQRGVALVILRVPGIYGPGRLPLDRLQRGDPIIRESEAPWSNRIHIDDLASATHLAGSLTQVEAIYNVSDGQPTSMTDYFNRLADTLGLPRPPQVSRAEAEQQLSASMLSFLNESRRIDNRRLLESLGLQLRYPDLTTGLKSCLPVA
ncbi:nucleoside-diphosphate-sugar epimerase [Methylohalomonas lacus]|uniref:Nucleoside-diphosphate-sugar epimerase n=1 Tax=Methylohalomonas lacus TaxID=398773 RepID=A0AAE3HJ17_9GAMM|nr:SDR family oxidoreductase [Methylohalomonas lacus]MCS3902750.1 nucleoside-diphosphate-sugar epimerase [Methylohalomonas lacus]